MEQHREDEVPSRHASGPPREAAGCPLQHVHTSEVLKKVLGNALQTRLQFSENNGKTPLLKD